MSDILVRLDQHCDNDGGSRSDAGLSTGTNGDNNVAPDLPANNNGCWNMRADSEKTSLKVRRRNLVKQAYLEVTFRNGRPLATYYYLPRKAGQKAVRTRCCGRSRESDRLAIQSTVGNDSAAC